MQIFTNNQQAYKSIHPGYLVADELEATNIAPDHASLALGLTKAELEQLCQGELDISPAIAKALEQLGIGQAKIWQALQQSHNAHPTHGGSRVGAGRKKQDLTSRHIRISAPPAQMQKIEAWLKNQKNKARAVADLIASAER
jgi:plasmid maintenance system antidote protein VapI